MRFYLNELSIHGLPVEAQELECMIRLFVKRCILLKKIGFREMRSNIHPLNIELAPGLILASWIKDRNSGNRELKTRFKSISLKSPLFNENEDHFRKETEWATFKYRGNEVFGIGAAYISESIVISFPTNDYWEEAEIAPVEFEYYEVDTNSIIIEPVSVRNVSHFTRVWLFSDIKRSKLRVR